MAQWQYKVTFKDLFEEYDKGEIALGEISKKMIERLEKVVEEIKAKNIALEIETLHIVEEIIENLKTFDEDGGDGVEKLDYILNDLYDWGDIPLGPNTFSGKKMCWISTTF